MVSFNLLREPWIKVIDNEYAEKEVSLITLFEQAHEFRSVTDSNPLVVASVYRLLLVILYRALQLPDEVEEWLDLYESGKFPVSVLIYLQSMENRFDLYSEEYPFFQSAGFRKDATTSVKKLTPDFATANNKTLFSHHADSEKFSIPSVDAARYLLVCQYFSFGGGISGSSNLAKKHPNYTHSPLIGGVLTYLTGDNLFKTLLFNLKPFSSRETCDEDIPIWENDNLNGTGVREPLGLLDYLTFKCRHIRLLPDELANVSEMYFAQGYSLPSGSSYRETEPAFAYRLNDKQEVKAVLVSFEKSFWRDSKSIYQITTIDAGNRRDLRPRCFRWAADLLSYGDIYRQGVSCIVVGIENDKRKAANPVYWLSEILPVSLALLEDSDVLDYFSSAIQTAHDISSKIYWAVYEYANVVSPSSPGEDEKKREKRVKKIVSEIGKESNYWSVLGLKFPSLVRDITKDKEQTYQNWLKTCLNSARRNLDDTLDNQLGRTTKELKAKSLAQHKLDILLAPFNKELSHEKE